MIEIINKPINDLFYNLVSDSKKTIRLCAPYVKQDIVNNIYVNKRKSVKIDFISNFSVPNFYKRSSYIEAFKTVMEWEDKVYNCQKLHAKFYIFDDKYSIITSSNLTPSGFKKNLPIYKDIDFENYNKHTEVDDIYVYEEIFSRKYPNNNTIKASIRRNLQEVRDLGLIKFLGNGKYKKLWSNQK